MIETLRGPGILVVAAYIGPGFRGGKVLVDTKQALKSEL
jgi:hypothetical protein